MRNNIKFIMLSVIAILFTSCGTSHKVSTSYKADGSTEKKVSTSSVFGKKDLVSLKEEWEYETLTATGEAPLIEKYKESSRNKLLARKGAILEAQRDLAEKVGNIRLNSRTTMRDFETSDVVRSRLNVVLKDVEVVKEDYDEKNKLYKVTIEMPKLKIINVLEETFN